MEAPKSKFVYPDKLYARTKNNITLDMSYAPQTLEAVEYTRTDAFIEKSQNFFRRTNYLFHLDGMELSHFIEEFRNYIKEL